MSVVMVTIVCDVCSEPFERSESKVGLSARSYCTKSCQQLDGHKPKPSKHGSVCGVCAWCGETYFPKPNERPEWFVRKQTCSRACAGALGADRRSSAFDLFGVRLTSSEAAVVAGVTVSTVLHRSKHGKSPLNGKHKP